MSNEIYIRYEVQGLRERLNGPVYDWIVSGVCKQPSPWHSTVLGHFATEAEAKAFLQKLEEAA